jgi:UDP:flavonoid glycosyltransferase YjiC (YdhE family)
LQEIISRAISETGVRAIVSSGCTSLESDKLLPPDKVFVLDNNIPHEWLFPHVSCVIHQGGADITAAGLAYGKPTIVLPSLGDQFFWGEVIARAGVGPTPIPYKSITSDSLARAIAEALSDQCQQKARKLATEIQKESGATAGALNLHEKLQVEDFRCSLAPRRLSVWRVKGSDIRLSTLAATILFKERALGDNDVEL